MVFPLLVPPPCGSKRRTLVPALPLPGDKSQRRRRRLGRRSLCPSARPPPAAAPALPARRTMEFSERKRSRKSQSFKLVNRGKRGRAGPGRAGGVRAAEGGLGRRVNSPRPAVRPTPRAGAPGTPPPNPPGSPPRVGLRPHTRRAARKVVRLGVRGGGRM